MYLIRRLLLILPVIFLACLPGCGEGVSGKKDGRVSEKAKRMNVGDIAPAFDLDGIDGRNLGVGPAGKPVLLNFFASWCMPCKEEATVLQSSYAAFGDRLDFAGIAVQDTPEGVVGFVRDFGITFPVGLDQSGDVSNAYMVFGLPKTVIINSDGRITYSHIGAVTEDILASEIEKLI